MMSLLSLAEATIKFLDITLGNVISWAVMISVVGAAWQKLKSNQESMEAQLRRQDQAIAALPQIERTAAVIEERLDQYHTRLHKVEEAIFTIEKLAIDMSHLTKEMRGRRQ